MFDNFKSLSIITLLCSLTIPSTAQETRPVLVLLSDFGTTERFVASMKGVAMSVDGNLQIHDLTHDVEPYDIWQASYLLSGTIEFWPKGTVFVAVIDPGVGTKRKSVVVQTGSGHYIVTPDNGTLTLVADSQGIVAMREIDESVNRRPGSEGLHTFHGRDVYSYTGARLAAGVIDFEGVGPELDPKIVRLSYQKPGIVDDQSVVGNLIHIERPFGNIVTNIPSSMLDSRGISGEDNSMVDVKIIRAGEVVFNLRIPYANTFGSVGKGEPLLYSDSSQTIGLAVNSASFAEKYKVDVGQDWAITITTLANVE